MLTTPRALFHEGLSPTSKAARCYLLVQDGRIDLPLSPRNAEPVHIANDQPVERAASDTLRECLDQIATNIVVVRRLDDPEGPHQLRNGLRRLRAALSVYVPALECVEAARLAREARWLYRCSGKLRDLDVVEQLIRSARSPELSVADAGSLVEECAERTGQARLDLRSILASGRTRSFLLDLAGFVETLGWNQPVSSIDRHSTVLPVLSYLAITQAWSSSLCRSQVSECPGSSERHKLRKDLRRLCYVIELFRSLYLADRVDPVLCLLRRLQNDLGDINDAALVETVLTRNTSTAAVNQSQQRAVNCLVGIFKERSEASWRSFESLWMELTNAQLFWR